MPVYEAVMKVGSWELELRPNTPWHIRDRIIPHATIVITPLQLSSPLADADMLAVARYHGIVHRPGFSYVIGGPGLAAYMGDEDYKGAYHWQTTTWTGNTLGYVWQILGIQPHAGTEHKIPLNVGAVANPAVNMTMSAYGLNRRKWLEIVCANYGMEYRVNPDLTLDVDTEAILYPLPSDGRRVLAVRRDSAGPDHPYFGIGSDVSMERDFDDYANYVYVRSSATTMGPFATVSQFRDASGNTVRREYLHEDSDLGTNTTLLTNVGNTVLAERNGFAGRRQVGVSTDLYDVKGRVKPGETMLVYDPDIGLTGTSADTVNYRGQRIRPAAVRAMAIRWNVSSGMGVYMRQVASPGGTPTYTDLTPYIAWEPPGATFEVGAIRRGLR